MLLENGTSEGKVNLVPGSIRGACASNGGERIDGHFGSARRFLVYQVAADGHRLIDCREIDDSAAEVSDDKNNHRAGLTPDSVAALRDALPELHFTYCADDDIGDGIPPSARPTASTF